MALEVILLLFVLLGDVSCRSTPLQVLPNVGDGLPAAYGDFNNDKQVDIFLIGNRGLSFSIGLHQITGATLMITGDNVTCQLNSTLQQEVIVGLIPSDYTGTSSMDVVVVTAKQGDGLRLRYVRGYVNYLQCSDLFNVSFAHIEVEPLLLDYNGDSISDLLIKPFGKDEYIVLLGGSIPFAQNVTFISNVTAKLRNPNSNAYTDLNGDCVADVFLDTEESGQYWFAQETGFGTKPSIVLPPIPNRYTQIGQSVFVDINGDRIIDHLIPVCTSNQMCAVLAYDPALNQWETLIEDIMIDTRHYTFEKNHNKIKWINLPMALRSGAFIGDVLPDLTAVMRETDKQENQLIVFENIESNTNSFKRGFRPISIFQSGLNKTFDGEIVSVSFLDMREDGQLDIVVASSTRNDYGSSMRYSVVLNANDDVNFFKILIASACHDCVDHTSKKIINMNIQRLYGSNYPGCCICYGFYDSKGNRREGCQVQLQQSANLALQLPYAIFDLGEFANYIDNVEITVPTGNTSHILKRKMLDIIPDSKIVVVADPFKRPETWKSYLHLHPSYLIVKTLYVFLGICGVLVVILLILRHREKLADLKEAEEYARFFPDSRR